MDAALQAFPHEKQQQRQRSGKAESVSSKTAKRPIHDEKIYFTLNESAAF